MPEAASDGPVVAVIPARGGSKRIPRKNIRPFLGVPLLTRTVEILRRTAVFDRIVVSTDDDEVVAIAEAAGAEAPFRRPAVLADDHTGTRPVMIHAIEALEMAGGQPLGPVCLVYPAAVFARPDDLEGALALLLASDADFVFSATTFPAPPQRALRLGADDMVEMLWPQHAGTRSQDLVEAFHDAGQFYWGRRAAWLSGGSALTSRSRLHVVPRWRAQDIDTEEDWTRAELLHRMLDER